MVLAICLVLGAAAVGFTLLVREQDIPPAPLESPELKHLETRRQVLYDNLKDLQFEYHQGKLTDEDYQSLKQGFLYELAAVMDSIEQLTTRLGKQARTARKPERNAEAAAKAAPPPAAAKTVCPSCQAENPAGHRFCGQCGKPLAS